MACFSKDCHWFKGHGDCFYDGVPPSNSPSACEECRFFKAPTNADRIRAMSDEELAEWLSCNCTGDGYGNSSEDWLDWLRQEYEEEES